MANRYEKDMWKGKVSIDKIGYLTSVYLIDEIAPDKEEVNETGTLNSQDIEITGDGRVGLPRSLKDRLNLF